jgi:1-phosphofructokinase
MIERCASKGATIVVDTSLDGLADLKGQNIWLHKLNREELAEMSGMSTETESEVIKAAYAVVRSADSTIRNVLATMGADGSVLVGESLALRGRVGVHPGRIISTVGCGDCLLAGFLAEYSRSGDWLNAMREGLAVATAGAIGRNAGFIQMEDVEEFREAAIIEPLEQ